VVRLSTLAGHWEKITSYFFIARICVGVYLLVSEIYLSVAGFLYLQLSFCVGGGDYLGIGQIPFEEARV
jgi:hypothetical protein